MEMNFEKIPQENIDLVKTFGAELISQLRDKPNFYTFKSDLIYSYRDFDKFFTALKKGEKCAIVSGLNASGTIHFGHKAVFDTNLFFQKKFGIPVFIPISDDESYVSKKVKSQEEALENSMKLAKELIAYGFDPKKTYIIIDQIFTNIYNLAIKLSTHVTLSEIKATYGYQNEDNPGLFFYPTVQSAHILFPQEKFGIKNVLVPIGPDEDAHLRICRDIAGRMGYNKPAVLHARFLPGLDGEKMSKSRANAIFFRDDEKTIRHKIGKAYSGGAKTVEEHRKYGGKPEEDISIFYLSRFFLSEKKSEDLKNKYKKGEILSSEVKKMFADKVAVVVKEFQLKVKSIKKEEIDKSILENTS